MKILLFANTDWYLYNFRLSLASALRSAGHEVVLASPSGSYVDKLNRLGFRCFSAPMERRSLNPWRELALVLWLRRLLVAEKIDLVHGFTIKCAVYGSMAGRWGGGAARVNSVAGMGYVFSSQDFKARLLRPLVRTALRLAMGGRNARLILQNPDDLALVAWSRLIYPSCVRLISGSGVDCQRFAPGGARLPDGRFRVLLPARLLWDKGVAEYVEAARLLRTEQRAIDFLLAGDPDLDNPGAVPKAQISGWVDEGLLQWLGHVDDMPALFASVDAVVLPSYYGEGVPKGLIEAAASGLALVTTDMPGCREVVTHEVDGLLVPPRDGPALAAAISRLAADPALCQRLGAMARKKALSHFDERIIVQQTLAVYRDLLGEGMVSVAPVVAPLVPLGSEAGP